MLRNVEDVKTMLVLAAEVDMALPKVQVQGAKSTWPDIRLSESEKKALRTMTREGKPDFSPTDEQIEIWYTICTEWAKAFLGSEKKRQQWVVIWLKACGCRVKTIERYVDFGRTKIWYQYEKGMAHLLNYLQVTYSSEELSKLETYKPELTRDYPTGKITGTAKISILKEWIEELESKNTK